MNIFLFLGIILLIAGFVFIGIETIVPGFGAPGIIGICCIVAGILLAADGFETTLIVTAVVLVLLMLMIFILLRFLSAGKIKPPIVLTDKLDKEQGYISGADLQYLIGKTGITTTNLHPSGKVTVDGVELDVISDGRFIGKGTQVEIYSVSNSSLVVRQKNSI